jgi:hypothetical protein
LIPSNEITNQTCITLILKKHKSNITLTICTDFRCMYFDSDYTMSWMICGVIHGRGVRFIPVPIHNIQTSCRSHPAFSPLLTEVLGLGLKCPEYQGVTYLRLVVRLTMGGAVPLFPIRLYAVNRTSLPYFFTLWWLKGQVVQILRLVVYGGLSWVSASTSYLKTQTSTSWNVICTSLCFLTLERDKI